MAKFVYMPQGVAPEYQFINLGEISGGWLLRKFEVIVATPLGMYSIKFHPACVPVSNKWDIRGGGGTSDTWDPTYVLRVNPAR